MKQESDWSLFYAGNREQIINKLHTTVGLVSPIDVHSIKQARRSVALDLGATIATQYCTNIADAELHVKCISWAILLMIRTCQCLTRGWTEQMLFGFNTQTLETTPQTAI